MEKAVLIGATGTIGSAVRRKLELAGYEVAGASRTSEISVDIENDESVKLFLESAGMVDAIVCTAGSAAFGEVQKLTDDDFNLSVRNKLLGQVKLLQKGLTYLKPGGTIVLTGGILGYKPVRGSAGIAMVNTGLEGFVRAAANEVGPSKKVIVIHPPLVAETAVKMGMDPAPFLSADEVANSYIEAIRSGKSGEPFFSVPLEKA